jgi:hypothetical protein
VQVDVPHRLARAPIAIEQRAKAVLGDARLARQPAGDLEEVTHESVVLGADVEERGNVPSRHYQNVKRRPRVDIAKSNYAVIFEKDIGRKLALADLTKRAAHGWY